MPQTVASAIMQARKVMSEHVATAMKSWLDHLGYFYEVVLGHYDQNRSSAAAVLHVQADSNSGANSETKHLYHRVIIFYNGLSNI